MVPLVFTSLRMYWAIYNWSFVPWRHPLSSSGISTRLSYFLYYLCSYNFPYYWQTCYWSVGVWVGLFWQSSWITEFFFLSSCIRECFLLVVVYTVVELIYRGNSWIFQTRIHGSHCGMVPSNLEFTWTLHLVNQDVFQIRSFLDSCSYHLLQKVLVSVTSSCFSLYLTRLLVGWIYFLYFAVSCFTCIVRSSFGIFESLFIF